MASAKDRVFTEIYRDASFANWGPAAAAYKVSAGVTRPVEDPVIDTDPTTNAPVIALQKQSRWSSNWEATALYDAGACQIGAVYGGGYLFNIGAGDGLHFVSIILSDTTAYSGVDQTGDLDAGTPFSATLNATTKTRRFAWLQSYYSAAFSGTDGQNYGSKWTAAVVYGTSGVPRRGSEPTAGLIRQRRYRQYRSAVLPTTRRLGHHGNELSGSTNRVPRPEDAV